VQTNADEMGCALPGDTYCPDGFERIPGANAGYCYHLKPMDEGPVWFGDALLYCLELNAFLARPNSIEQVEALADHLGITKRRLIPGYWIGYRRRAAPLNGSELTSAVGDIRGNFAEYLDIYTQCPRVNMFPNVFRQPSQPGDVIRDGTADEQCVAKKRPGKGSLVGLDSYECDNFHKHYVICEKCEELTPMPSVPP